MAAPSVAAAAAAAAVIAVVWLCLPAAAATAASGPHMADLSVLLPPRMTKPVEYRLMGGDGCFTWSWDHHDIISVKTEYNDSSRCSTSARLTSIAPYSGRRETSVYATDIISGITIHCKVFVDKISRIRIFHHAVKIDLDEIATLRVHAFDDEDNIFSSLVGLQFLWKLTPRSLNGDNNHHLVHIPLKETPLSDCGGFCGDMNIRFELEDKDLGSDFFVVKGIEIGQEVVSAQLFEPQLEHVVDTITLTVAEAMSLAPPSPVLVTVGVLVKFKLRVFRQKIAQVCRCRPFFRLPPPPPLVQLPPANLGSGHHRPHQKPSATRVAQRLPPLGAGPGPTRFKPIQCSKVVPEEMEGE